MDVPTFYFVEKNYEENKLEQLISILAECGARAVVIRYSENKDNFHSDLCKVIANHM